LTSGFRRDIDEICALLEYHAASCGNCLPTFRDNVSSNIPEERRSHHSVQLDVAVLGVLYSKYVLRLTDVCLFLKIEYYLNTEKHKVGEWGS
jgi:hypothetical protein